MARNIESRVKKLEGPTSGASIVCLIRPGKQELRRVKQKHASDRLILYIANIKRDKTNGKCAT